MEIVPITSEMLTKAKELEVRVLSNAHLKDTPNYTGLMANGRYFCGYLGELILFEFFKSRGKRVDYHIRLDGQADGGDFEVFLTAGGSEMVDCKTACEGFHSRIMLPQAQFMAHRYKYYVGVKINSRVGEVWGYCLPHELKLRIGGFDGSHVPTRYLDLAELGEIDMLLSTVANGPTNTTI